MSSGTTETLALPSACPISLPAQNHALDDSTNPVFLYKGGLYGGLQGYFMHKA
jgi:hypothetical protein